MQFKRKTSLGTSGLAIKLFIKIIFLFFILFLLVILIDKINFPYPNKKIDKIISNENFKIVK
tara:strand:- start:366 stop:551 length:186 start_codon:yes stop_codon:yes gene_type:complete